MLFSFEEGCTLHPQKMALNLFYALPDVLMSEIYQFDSTYRIFGKEEFKKDLADSFLTSPHVVKKCRDMVVSYLDGMIYDQAALWCNEYGRIDPDGELNRRLIHFTSIDDFRVVTMINDDRSAIFFKILPVKMISTMVPFLGNHNTKNWDGYFIDAERVQDNAHLDQLCVRNSTDVINGGEMDIETGDIVWVAPRIEMHFA